MIPKFNSMQSSEEMKEEATFKKKRGTITIELNDKEILYKGHGTQSVENTLETPTIISNSTKGRLQEDSTSKFPFDLINIHFLDETGGSMEGLTSLFGQFISNAKVIGDQAMTKGSEITKQIEQISFKDRLADGTQRLLDGSARLSSDVYQATSEKLHLIKVVY